METPRRSTRSSVLGKRPHQSAVPSSPTACEQTLPTPENTPNPKRARLGANGLIEGDGNKENIAPFRTESLSEIPVTPTRSLRRTSTELGTTPPSRLRSSIRRHASTSDISATPSTEIAKLAISTPPPTPPTSLLPIHARARTCLRATNASEMAGREQERAKILHFVDSFLTESSDKTTTSLYISGSPGTGKTGLVTAVLRSLDLEDDSCKIITVNCMALANIDGLWDRLLEELDNAKNRKTAGKLKRLRGREAVELLLTGVRTKCIIVLDELDHIASTQSLVSVFSLPQSSVNNLRVIGIANTHTLTTGLSQSAVDCNKSVQTLHFAPYTPTQLFDILQTRLSPLNDNADGVEGESPKKFLPVPTLTLLTKKIAAQTGDVRSLFEVLRGAIDLAVAPGVQNAENPLAAPTPAVTPTHILAALKAYSPTGRTNPSRGKSSEIVSKVTNVGLQAQLALMATLLAFRRLDAGLDISTSTSASVTKSPVKPSRMSAVTKSPVKPSRTSVVTNGIDATQLHAYYRTVLTRADNDMSAPVSRSEFCDLLGMLEVVGLVQLSSSSVSATLPGTPSKGKRAFGRSASFSAGANKQEEVQLADGIRGEEALRGLGVSEQQGSEDVKSEVICSIWRHETARFQREVKAMERAQRGGEPSFEGAMED